MSRKNEEEKGIGQNNKLNDVISYFYNVYTTKGRSGKNYKIYDYNLLPNVCTLSSNPLN